jgi:hypothetical protein
LRIISESLSFRENKKGAVLSTAPFFRLVVVVWEKGFSPKKQKSDKESLHTLPLFLCAQYKFTSGGNFFSSDFYI